MFALKKRCTIASISAVISIRSFSHRSSKLSASDVIKLESIKRLASTTLSDALWTLKYPQSYIGGISQLVAPKKSEPTVCGYATTLSFVPFRPDIAQTIPKRHESPEYQGTLAVVSIFCCQYIFVTRIHMAVILQSYVCFSILDYFQYNLYFV